DGHRLRDERKMDEIDRVGEDAETSENRVHEDDLQAERCEQQEEQEERQSGAAHEVETLEPGRLTGETERLLPAEKETESGEQRDDQHVASPVPHPCAPLERRANRLPEAPVDQRGENAGQEERPPAEQRRLEP